jgi:hypothetical protein
MLGRISGDASTIRLAGTDPDLHQVLDGLLAARHLLLEQGAQELGPVQARELGTLALRDPALAIPLDRRRPFELSRQILVRGRIRKRQVVREDFLGS